MSRATPRRPPPETAGTITNQNPTSCYNWQPRQRKKTRQWLVLCAVAVLFTILGGLLVFLFLGPDEATVLPKIGEVSGNGPLISYEEVNVFPEPVTVEQPAKKVQVSPVTPDGGDLVAKTERPLVAIVIDDMGYNKKTCEALLALDLNLSFAFLPYGPYTAQQASRANRLGRDVLLHFPMEASDLRAKPGPGTVTIAMDPPDIRRIFADNNRFVGKLKIREHHRKNRW